MKNNFEARTMKLRSQLNMDMETHAMRREKNMMNKLMKIQNSLEKVKKVKINKTTINKENMGDAMNMNNSNDVNMLMEKVM